MKLEHKVWWEEVVNSYLDFLEIGDMLDYSCCHLDEWWAEQLGFRDTWETKWDASTTLMDVWVMAGYSNHCYPVGYLEEGAPNREAFVMDMIDTIEERIS